MVVACPYCGTFEAPGGNGAGHVAHANQHEAICPRCEMTPGEHAYRARILADSAAVFVQEWRAFQAERAARRAVVS